MNETRLFGGVAWCWAAFLSVVLTLGTSATWAQEDEGEAPEPAEPFIPYSEQPAEESALDRDLRNCQETLGYVACEELRHGKPGAGGRRPPPKPDVWGAIAISPSTLKYGTASNEKSEDAAKQAALARCRSSGAGDCGIQKTAADVCLAVAFSRPERLYGIGGPIGAGNFADDAAMLKCQRGGGRSCAVEVSFCADGERHQLNGHTEFANGNPIFVPDAGTPSFLASARQPAVAGNDTAKFYGSWTTVVSLNGQSITVLSLHDARGYRNFTVLSNGNQPLDSGTFWASNGHYRTSAAKPNDSGTYRFVDSDTAICTNAAGQTATWKRQTRPVDANTAAAAETHYSPPVERPGTAVKK